MNLQTFLQSEEPRLVFFSGAGLSKESGINTFRDADGTWEKFDVNKVCNIDTFMSNYKTVHDFYNARRVQLSTVEPNAAHFFIAEMQKKYGDRVLHFTANVDDLCERAGGTACHVHGSLLEVIDNYTRCGEFAEIKKLGYEEWIPDPEVNSKPNIVFFGESTRFEDGKKVYIYDDMNNVLFFLRPQDTAIIIGSGDQVLEWSYMCGKRSQAFAINVNPVEQQFDNLFQENIYKPATEAIPDILDFIEKRM